MFKFTKRIVSLCLVLSCFMSIFNPNIVKASEFSSTTVKEIIGERSDIVFLEGLPGDAHLVYIYKEDGKEYKVIEDADTEFKNVDSIIYILDSDGNYLQEEKLELTTQFNGELVLERTESNGKVSVQNVYTPKQINLSTLTSDGTTGEWVTTYRNGNTHIKNYTITAIIAALSAAAAGTFGAPAAAALGSIAATYFERNVTYAYFREIYNYMLSSYSAFVIVRETCHTSYYSDSSHANYIGYTYWEYDGR